MKRIFIDRTQLMGKVLAIEAGCLDSQSRTVIHRIKQTILSMPIREKEEREDE